LLLPNPHTEPLPTADAHHVELSGGWDVYPISLDADAPTAVPASGTVHIPDCAHLQPILYPERPYWGDHLRAINEQAWVYRKTFRLLQTTYRRARLRFEAVDYFAEVWLNGHYLGKHEGNFAPFEFDISQALQPDVDNTLMVRVTSPWDAPNPRGNYPADHVIRGLIKGLYEHGEGVIPPAVNPIGIWRPVSVLLDNGVSIDHIRIRTQLDGQIDVLLRVTNSGHSEWQGQLSLKINAENHDGLGNDMNVDVTLAPGLNFIEKRVTLVDPRLWWSWDHGRPDLYRLTAMLSIGEGEVTAQETRVFGVRTVRLERAPDHFTFWLNERPISLRGSSYMPALYLSQATPEFLGRDLKLARDANLNLLRVHVHVSPPELYDLCDRAGILVWQDFELNWIQDSSPEFERRALSIQRDMIDLLDHHPSVVMWACHNEPTMVFVRRHNLEICPAPALYDDAQAYDPTRPVFICSGQMDSDWQRSGDSHWYFGAIWSRHYTDIRQHWTRLLSEFGFEAPAALDTLRSYPDLWERLKHLDGQIEELWAYQAALTQYQMEYVRRLRADGCAGYVQFSFNDMVPQVGCGVLDANRIAKGGYEALKRASQPLLISLDYDAKRPLGLWVCNDTANHYPNAKVRWQVYGAEDELLYEREVACDVAANCSQMVTGTTWPMPLEQVITVKLMLLDSTGATLSENSYDRPFVRRTRPKGYPWKFDPYLGTKTFNREDAPSLADHGVSPLLRLVPLRLREDLAERALRRHWPVRLSSAVARIADRLL
jgi:beta-mannosidase